MNTLKMRVVTQLLPISNQILERMKKIYFLLEYIKL